MNETTENEIQVRIDGDRDSPRLIYLPGVHGDWTLLASFREAARTHFQLIQITYPRTLTWTIKDYAQAVDKALTRLGIVKGWVLAESYSSQVAWAWLDLSHRKLSAFSFDGIILAGGFVRYPYPWMVRLAERFLAVAPWWLWKILFWIYVRYSGFRHRHAPENESSAHEFVARRNRLDIGAMCHRLQLIATYDPSYIASAASCPVYFLGGFIDPIVPRWPVLRWLDSNCPTFRSKRIIWPADHNVLGTEPTQSAGQIYRWIR